MGCVQVKFGYRLWDPINKKIMRSRDVIFFENKTIKELDKKRNLESSSEKHDDLDSVFPSVMHDEYIGDV